MWSMATLSCLKSKLIAVVCIWDSCGRPPWKLSDPLNDANLALIAVSNLTLVTNTCMQLFPCRKFGSKGPFWGRSYLFWHGGRPLTLIYEVFSSGLGEFLGADFEEL